MTASHKDEMDGRRRTDRRQSEIAVPVPERRKSERRSGQDRRAQTRLS